MKLFKMLFFLLLAGCTFNSETGGDQPLLRVNGENISSREFLFQFDQIKSQQDEVSQKNPKIIDQLKSRALNEVLILTLVRQQAAKRQIRVPKEEVESRLANWKDGYPPGGFEEMLHKENLTEDSIKKRLEDQLLVEKMVTNLFGAETLVSDEEMRTYFKDHENDFSRLERIHAFQIVVPSRDEAEKIRSEILAQKTSFESAARQYSLSPDGAKGGDLGFFAKNEKIAAFNEAFSLSLGSISRPIQSRYGFHLIKVVEKQPAKKLNFNEARNDLVKTIRRQKEAKVYSEWLNKLLKDGEFYRNDSLYSKLP